MKYRLFSSAWRRHIFFTLLARLLPRRKKQGGAPWPQKTRSVLVLAPVHRGDYIILSPLLHAISHALPNANIGVLVKASCLELATVDPHVDTVFQWNNITTWPRTIRDVRKFKPEIAIMPKGHPSVTELMILLLSGAPVRMALSHPQHDMFLTHAIQHNWENEHRSVAFTRMLQPFGVDPSSVSRRLHIGTTPEAERWADETLDALQRGESTIAINVSALNDTRVWTLQGWKALIHDMISVEPNLTFLALGMPADHAMLRSLAGEFNQVYTLPTPGMLEAVALIARCDALITVDTGIVQAAAARGIPMVVLYNGDHEVYTRFGPQSVPHRAVLAERGRAVSTIQAADVFHEVFHLLTERKVGNWIIRRRPGARTVGSR